MDWLVKRAGNIDVERQHLNRILQEIRARADALTAQENRIANMLGAAFAIAQGGGGDEGGAVIPGPTGPAGATGAAGGVGAAGQQGPAVFLLDEALDGEQGFPGPRGADGAAGAQGIQGIQGPMGIPIYLMPDCIDGEMGPPGPQGPQGPPGGGGGGNSVTATVDFTAAFLDKASVVVTGQTWVTATSEIVGQVRTPSGTDVDEMYLLNFRVVISDLVVGVGFTVTVYSEAEATGTYDVMCIGV